MPLWYTTQHRTVLIIVPFNLQTLQSSLLRCCAWMGDKCSVQMLVQLLLKLDCKTNNYKLDKRQFTNECLITQCCGNWEDNKIQFLNTEPLSKVKCTDT